MQQRTKSQQVYNNLCEVIPGGVNSPVRACLNVKQLPLVCERAHKDLIYDVDGHSYIDFCGSWGALIHGHSHPTILDAAYQRMLKGTTFGVTTEIEEQLARTIVKLMPSIEKIRFVSTGTEATMSVARLARGYTKRDIIVKFAGNFHGHADFFLVQAGSGVLDVPTASSAGIPPGMVKEMVCLPYNDIEKTRELLRSPVYQDRIAGVILEPIAGNIGVVPAKKAFLEMLREETKKIGALLIFDEVITGFRVGLGGAQAHYGITPDLTCLGKIIGGGFPAAAFGGRAEIMNQLAPLGSVYQSGTLSGNPVAMQAGLEALKMVQKPGFYEELHKKSDFLLDPMKEYIHKHHLNACIQQVGSMFTLFFGKKLVENMDDVRQLDHDKFGEFFRYMFSNGVYIPPLHQEAWFVSDVHEDKNLLKAQSLILAFLKTLH